jgi:hypothetical protein
MAIECTGADPSSGGGTSAIRVESVTPGTAYDTVRPADPPVKD